MATFTDKEILQITNNKYAECGRTDPEECDRVVGGIIDTLRNEGKIELAVEVAGNIATSDLRAELIAELEQEAAEALTSEAA